MGRWASVGTAASSCSWLWVEWVGGWMPFSIEGVSGWVGERVTHRSTWGASKKFCRRERATRPSAKAAMTIG